MVRWTPRPPPKMRSTQLLMLLDFLLAIFGLGASIGDSLVDGKGGLLKSLWMCVDPPPQIEVQTPIAALAEEPLDPALEEIEV